MSDRKRTDEQSHRTTTSPSSGQQPRQATAPLVIVSEQGRHTQASRRIVRSQAARASAAQSRLTRARNRGERESTSQSLQTSPVLGGHNQPLSPDPSLTPIFDTASGVEVDVPSGSLSQQPLASWVQDLKGLFSRQPSILYDPANFSADTNSRNYWPNPASLQLPVALPRGFVDVRHRAEISDWMLSLISRTACFDLASPGLEHRLRHLLSDLVVAFERAAPPAASLPSCSVENYLRIACVCLTLFQVRHADGQDLAENLNYKAGLDAAWAEAIAMDPLVLSGWKLADISLWTVFIIGVTTGDKGDFFHPILQVLFRDLQVTSWERIRHIMLDFIYPVSLLDQLCQDFYHALPSSITLRFPGMGSPPF